MRHVSSSSPDAPVRSKCHRPRVRINKIINLELTQDLRVLPSTGVNGPAGPADSPRARDEARQRTSRHVCGEAVYGVRSSATWCRSASLRPRKGRGVITDGGWPDSARDLNEVSKRDDTLTQLRQELDRLLQSEGAGQPLPSRDDGQNTNPVLSEPA
jgi:hypothetical protein